MTIPERTPLAMDHGLNTKRIAALLELFDGNASSAHHSTLVSLRDRDMVRFRTEDTSQPYLTEHGKTVARGLLELDDTPEEATAEEETAEILADPETMAAIAEAESEDVEFKYGVVLTPEGHQPVEPVSFDEAVELPNTFSEVGIQLNPALVDGPAQPLTATFQVICRARRSGEHSRLIAVVVGSESDAQRVADQWNLAHIADIAGRADATYAVAVPAEVGVYLFERFAVVAHD